MWDLLIESVVWNQRLKSLRSPEKVVQEYSYSKVEGIAGRETASTGNLREVGDADASVRIMSETFAEVNEISLKEIPISGSLQESNEQDDPSNTLDIPQNVKIQTSDDLGSKRSSDKKLESSSDVLTQFPSANGHLQVHENIPIATDIQPSRPIADSKVFNKSASLHSPVSVLPDSNEWFWKPFADIRQMGVREFQKSFFPKFEYLFTSITEHVPTVNQLITEEGPRLHIPLKTDNHIVSDFEGEPSSIIACALALLKDSSEVTDIVEGDVRENGITSKSTDFSNGSQDSDAHSSGTTSSEGSQASRATENHSIEVHLGSAKSLGREKYSVICHYFKQFRALRNWCCPSEIGYIASLSRCMNWDAKGGKSKSFFAKTLDDRFIIKEIKKTELDAFLGFSSLYFKHMRESFESGSQTCLAKILGIYQVCVLLFYTFLFLSFAKFVSLLSISISMQVTKRHIKSGKEVKHDLVVMENLAYNRNIVRQYDLKGALFERYTSAAVGAGDVLLDQNFVNDMNSSPLYVSHKAKRVLQRAVWNDTAFLNVSLCQKHSTFELTFELSLCH
jgi:1-phosphatidylinositol-3-phosphate 5-kinase